MPKPKTAPELAFQQNIADYLNAPPIVTCSRSPAIHST